MPSRALSSDDGDAGRSSRNKKSQGRTSKNKAANVLGKEAGLAAIDITTPLEEHERIPELKPYTQTSMVVLDKASSSKDRGGDGEEDKGVVPSRRRQKGDKGKGEGGDSKDRKHKHKHKHKHAPSAVPATAASDDFDLIGFMAPSPGTSHAAGTVGAVPARVPVKHPTSSWENDLSKILGASAPDVGLPAPRSLGVGMLGGGGGGEREDMAMDLSSKKGSGEWCCLWVAGSEYEVHGTCLGHILCVQWNGLCWQSV
ncbi:unnamed protein product [Choristocarpus tenellus]